MPEDKPENQETQKKESNTDTSSNLESHKKASRTWINKTIIPLIRFSPVGGSGFMLISLFLQQKWVYVIISFPITLVAVIWAAYSDSFLTTFSEIYAQRGRQDANSLMTWVDKVDKSIKETIKWQLAGVEDKYLQSQGNDCKYCTTEGTASIFTPILKDVFVPLELSAEFIQDNSGQKIPNPRGYQWDKELVKLMDQQDGLTIWDVLKRAQSNSAYRTLAILAWGGYGKTTLLRYVTYTYAFGKLQRGVPRGVPKLLPVLILLRKWQGVISEEKPDLVTLIEKHYLPSLPGKKLSFPPNWVKNSLDNGKMLVMFDGYDEVKEEWRTDLGKWIEKSMNDYPNSYFILTSRPAGYKSYQGENQLNILRLKAFNQSQRDRFIRQWYLSRERHISAKPDNPIVEQTANQKSDNLIEQLNTRDELNDLAKNPLLLNMIVNLHSVAIFDPSDYSRKTQLPQRRSQLYREILKLQLGDRPLVKQIAMCLEADIAQKILQELAFSMVINNQPEIKEKILKNELEKIISKLRLIGILDQSVDINLFLNQMLDVSELLVKKDEDYEFAHLSFQGYLASKEIIETSQEDLLIDNCDKSWWRETILLYSAQVNPNNLLRKLISIDTKDSVTLALRCIEETPKKIEPEVKTELDKIKDKLEEILFYHLEQFLKDKQWQRADEETTRLMLQLGDKEEKGYLSLEDCKNFPKEELRTIDQLWLEHSNNKFGFSVQKRIYLEEGGKLDSIDYESWKRMAKRVGWIDAPPTTEDLQNGHFPGSEKTGAWDPDQHFFLL